MNRVTSGAAALTSAPFDEVDRVRTTFKILIQVDENKALRLEQARLAVGILGRSFTNVCVQGVTSPPKLGHIASLRGTVDIGSVQPDLTINFGGPEPTAAHIHGDYQGWGAVLSTTTASQCNGENVLAALYASSLACQHAFNTAFRGLVPQIDILEGQAAWDLASGQEGNTPEGTPALGPCALDVSIIGIGAVGQAMVHALSLLPGLAGDIELIDHEFLDAGNMDRYILTVAGNVGQYKPHVARAVLAHAHPLLRVTYPAPRGQYPLPDQAPPPIEWSNRHALPVSAGAPGWSMAPRVIVEYLAPPLTYLAWRDLDATTPRRLVVAAVDSAVTRRDIQFGLHAQTLNVWTDSGEARNTWGYSFHTIGDRECMACQYHDTVQDPGSALDFKARQVGWPAERVRAHLEDQTKVLSQADLQDLQRQKGLSAEYLHQFLGKPLKRFIEGLCGQGTLVGNDRVSAPPVPHVPVIVGIHAVATLVLRALGHNAPSKVQGDSLRAPATSFSMKLGPATKGCLCQNAAIQAWYKDYWNLQDRIAARRAEAPSDAR